MILMILVTTARVTPVSVFQELLLLKLLVVLDAHDLLKLLSIQSCNMHVSMLGAT